MNYQRSDRVGDLLVEMISELLREQIQDPRVATVTLTGAKVSKDLRHARMYFTILGGQADKREVLAGLRSATGFIRSRVGRELKLRYVPTLEFFYDESEDEAARIDELLKQVQK
jgi:ribosome-binding factor A